MFAVCFDHRSLAWLLKQSNRDFKLFHYWSIYITDSPVDSIRFRLFYRCDKNSHTNTVRVNSTPLWTVFRLQGMRLKRPVDQTFLINCNWVTLTVKLCWSVLSEACSREEFMCDSGRCLLPVSVCDSQPNCQDHSDEANCSHKYKGESPKSPNELSFTDNSLFMYSICGNELNSIHKHVNQLFFLLLHVCE